jgi:DNA polymerase III epsilon subunit-like protein
MQFTRWQQLLDSLDYPLVFTDLETTSANIERAQILEVGCVFYGPPRLIDRNEAIVTMPQKLERVPGLADMKRCRCNPGKGVLASSEFKRSEQIHHLSAAILKGHPTFAAQAEQIVKWLDVGYVIGFNSEHYDMPLLVRRLMNAGYQLDPATGVSIDVWRIMAHIVELTAPPTGVEDPRQYGTPWDAPGVFIMSDGLAAFKQNLSTCFEALLGMAPDKAAAHGSLYDNMMTAHVLAAAMELWPEHVPATIEGLQRMSNVPPRNWPDWEHFLHFEESTKEWTFTRGEHRGLALQEVPSGYLGWMMKKGTFDPATLRIVRYYDRTMKHLYPGVLRAEPASDA